MEKRLKTTFEGKKSIFFFFKCLYMCAYFSNIVLWFVYQLIFTYLRTYIWSFPLSNILFTSKFFGLMSGSRESSSRGDPVLSPAGRRLPQRHRQQPRLHLCTPPLWTVSSSSWWMGGGVCYVPLGPSKMPLCDFNYMHIHFMMNEDVIYYCLELFIIVFHTK